MKNIQLKTSYFKRLADTSTPVSIYLTMRDRFPNSILLESSDYHGNDNSYSFIGLNPIASFILKDKEITIDKRSCGGDLIILNAEENDVMDTLKAFSESFEVEENDFPFINGGVFGYSSFEAVEYFEDISFDRKVREDKEVPDMIYQVYQNIIAINHFKNELYVFEHIANGRESVEDELKQLLNSRNLPVYTFRKEGSETSNVSDEEYLNMVRNAKKHCVRGDVFQLVLSRSFSQSFKGDDFNLYRALRSINPSPYLFYFDYGSFRVFGSSPEAQIVIKGGQAEIHPIAGTFRRTGDDEKDQELAEDLKKDEKENAEHVMLVDLARNDLSKHGSNAKVETYREIQFYSHVIHLVSKVTADIQAGSNSLRLVGDTFPAGTLSGAPKHSALQLINDYENEQRGIYGGCIGYLGFNGDFNQAIIIRSFLSKNNQLIYQAGAGVVHQSNEDSELQEVNNKLAALKMAIDLAETV